MFTGDLIHAPGGLAAGSLPISDPTRCSRPVFKRQGLALEPSYPASKVSR
jgi:hypothetical protein